METPEDLANIKTDKLFKFVFYHWSTSRNPHRKERAQWYSA